MQLITSKNAGFCFGVQKSVKIVTDLLAAGNRVCVLGELVHNNVVINELKKKGMRIIESIEQASPNELLVLRAHGSLRGTLDELKERGYSEWRKGESCERSFLNLACVFVTKIHKLVQNAMGYSALIVLGDPKHFEVRGIVSYFNGLFFVVSSSSEFKELLDVNKWLTNEKVCVVVQTTYNVNELEECKRYIKKMCTKLDFFDTICKETRIRQEEVTQISKVCDLVLVVGSKHSSNTKKLLSTCKRFAEARLVENAKTLDELDLNFKKFSKIGIVTGASVPLPLFEEVKVRMEKISDDSFDFSEELDKSFKRLRVGEQIKGIVARVSPSEIQLDIDAKYAGYISAQEFSDEDVRLTDAVNCGDEIEAVVVRINDLDGSVELSRKKVINQGAFNEVAAAIKTREILRGKVVRVLDAGVLVVHRGVKIFIHNSQLNLKSSETSESLLGSEVSFIVSAVDEGRRSAKGSIRAADMKRRSEVQSKIWETMLVGQRLIGEVKSITNFGVFVDLGGIDGLVHISELSWENVKRPEDFCAVGDKIEVIIKQLDRENNRISLTCKKEEENPWLLLRSNFNVGDVVEVTVVGIKEFGVFVRLLSGIDGLIHISQLSNEYVRDANRFCKISDKLKAKIVEIDDEKRRVKLSVKALQETDIAAQKPELTSSEVNSES